MKINLFINTRLDPALSMKIYSSQLIKHLKKINKFNIQEISIKGKKLPFIKNFLSKDIYYPIYAKFKEVDINHITDHSYGALAYFLKPEKTIVTCHDLNALEFPKQSSWLGRKRFLYNLKGMLRAKHIIAVSESTKKTILKHFDYKGKIYVIYNGIDKRFKVLKNKKELRKKYKLNENYNYLLHVGVPYLYKNVEPILKVLKKLPNCKLIKIGEFNSKQSKLIQNLNLQDKIIQYNNLQFSSLIELYNIIDLLVFPSFYEGFGFPVLEAMACGCPVICSNTTSLPEVGGNASYYINPYYKDELEKGIKKVLENPELRKKMIKKGLKQAKKFSWEKTANHVIKIYQNIMKEK